MAKTSVMVAWNFFHYIIYLQLTVPRVSECCPLGLPFFSSSEPKAQGEVL